MMSMRLVVHWLMLHTGIGNIVRTVVPSTCPKLHAQAQFGKHMDDIHANANYQRIISKLYLGQGSESEPCEDACMLSAELHYLTNTLNTLAKCYSADQCKTLAEANDGESYCNAVAMPDSTQFICCVMANRSTDWQDWMQTAALHTHAHTGLLRFALPQAHALFKRSDLIMKIGNASNEPVTNRPESTGATTESAMMDTTTLLIIIGGGVVALLVLVLLGFCCCGKSKGLAGGDETTMESSFGGGPPPPRAPPGNRPSGSPGGGVIGGDQTAVSQTLPYPEMPMPMAMPPVNATGMTMETAVDDSTSTKNEPDKASMVTAHESI